MLSGIYTIRNRENGKVYVGKSKFVWRRISQHFDALSKGRHHCKPLQDDFDRYQAIAFAVDWECYPEEELEEWEAWILRWRKSDSSGVYNILPALHHTITDISIEQYSENAKTIDV